MEEVKEKEQTTTKPTQKQLINQFIPNADDSSDTQSSAEEEHGEVEVVKEKDVLRKNLLFYKHLNLERPPNFIFLAVIRYIMEITLTLNQVYPDEYWQGTEVAYDIVYGGVDLPWEWQSKYRIRNVLYPLYLSIPLWILKTLRLDTFYMVRAAPYFAHGVLVVAADYYFYKVGKRYFGIQATRVALFFYFTNRFFNAHLIRCFSNSFETIIHVVVFHYYGQIENRFDCNLQITAVLLSIALGIRNTSIIGWVPLLLFKMYQKQAYKPFILTAFVVAIPSLLVIILIDSIYYGQFTVSAYNFLVVNLVDNVSAEFGVEPKLEFITKYMPKALPYYAFYLLISGFFYHLYLCYNKKETPVIAFFVVFYLTIISIVPHKEERFMHPIFPFLFLMAGQLIVPFIKMRFIGVFFGLALLAFSVFNFGLFIGQSIFDGPLWQPIDYILATDPNPHSVFHMTKYDAPLYSWFHKRRHEQKVELFFPKRAPPFARTKFGLPIAYRIGVMDDFCLEMYDTLMSGQIRPKYVILPLFPCRGNQMYCHRACEEGLRDMYEPIGKFPRFQEKDYWSQYFDIGEGFITAYRLRNEFRPYY